MNSLIKQDAAQPTLFELGEAAEPFRAAGLYTGELLFRCNRPKYDAIVAALGEGLGVRAIARALGVHTMTVRAVREREGEAVADEKMRTASKLRQFARMGAERLVEEVDDIPIDKLPLAVAIAVDKAQLLHGEATERIETVKSYSPDDWERLVAALPAIPIEAEVVETGFIGREDRQTGGDSMGG